MDVKIMKLFAAITLSLFVVLASAGTDAAPDLTRAEAELLPLLYEEDLEAVHDQAKEILRSCRPPECVIVSLGTTNTLIDSFLRYYLKADADRGIHYVPIRELRSVLSIPAVLERMLPQPSPGLKRVMVVRSLFSGATVAYFADAINRHFSETGAPYELEAFFSVAYQAENVRASLENRSGFSPLKVKFPWPYVVRKLPDPVAIDGSYRAIDDAYYRYLPLIFNFDNFWSDFKEHPKVVDFKKQVERSVGADSSSGPTLFATTEEVKDAWAMALTHDFKAENEPFLIFPLFLSHYSEAARNYAAAMKTVQREVFQEFEYPEGVGYKTLDQMVKLFIESPEIFTQNKCAALTGSKLK